MPAKIDYAQAFWDVLDADKEKHLAELKSIAGYFTPDLKLWLKSPEITDTAKKEMFCKAFHPDPLLLAFIDVLIERKAIHFLPEIEENLENMAERKDIVAAEVISAKPLTLNEEEKIKEYLANKLKKDVRIKNTVNPELMGGIVVKYQGKILDASLLAQKTALYRYLKK